MANDSVAMQIKLSAEAVSDVRKALAYGLSSLHEVLRLREEADEARQLGKPLLDEQIPVLPNERPAKCLEAFADAYLWLADTEQQH